MAAYCQNVVPKSRVRIEPMHPEEKMENYIFERDSSLIPKNDLRGYKSDFVLFSTKKSRKDRKVTEKKRDSIYGSYLKVFNANYKLKIDSMSYISDFFITIQKNQLGFVQV